MGLPLRKFAFGALLATAPTLSYGQAPVGELFSTVAHVHGSVTLAGSGAMVMSGSSIESGAQPARLELNRGGQLIICQGTTVSVSASPNGRDLMFSLGSGTIESHYKINASSDVIVTPDLRFVITGPGEFDLNVSISPKGDTCMRSSPASTGGVIVNEQMGDGAYQVKPSDFVIFRKGRIANAETNPSAMPCGCPVVKAPARQVQVAKSQPAPAPPPPTPAAAPAPHVAVPEHVVAETPFVFNADAMPPTLSSRVMRLRVENTTFADVQPEVLPPPKPRKKGFWRRLFGS